ncbi:hypothetical protein [Okeania sp.]|uniref:hypothetical protein n=1 Tax=Okeania sp. TaxID=3100323 RepID=UPI002B4B2332|nr:hypothetical protein [Okeania sp.]MEB3340956.1 hypothetical protein [Okeania sp.]
MTTNKTTTESNKTTDTSSKTATQSSQPTKLDQGSQQRTTLQVETKPAQDTKESGKLALPGNRPIGTINLKYTRTISNRPIVSTGLKVDHTISASGIRPVAVSGLEVQSTITASGVRPIGTNHLEVTQTLMNRPVASNQIDSEGLMGFID